MAYERRTKGGNGNEERKRDREDEGRREIWMELKM